MRRLFAVATATLVVMAMAWTPVGARVTGPDPAELAASVAPDNDRACHTSMVDVTLRPGTMATPGDDLGLGHGAAYDAIAGPQQVLAKLCLPTDEDGAATVPATVQVLIHGITYDHRYWNIADPDDPAGNRYSWEHAAARAGYATLAIDRIGNGASSHPSSALVDISTNAGVIEQLVASLRDGTLEGPTGGVTFERVVLVGHSYGSMTSWTVADGSDQIDGLIITGASHNVQEVNAPVSIETGHYPAVLDPLYAESGHDPGYVTSRPGTRYDLFYAPSTDVDMRVVARDEATKGTFSQWEVQNYPVIFRTEKDVRVPVLYLIGDLDGIFCSLSEGDLGADCSSPETLLAGEAPWLGPAVPSLDAVIIPDAGHDLNAFRSSQTTFGAAMDWLTATVPAS